MSFTRRTVIKGAPALALAAATPQWLRASEAQKAPFAGVHSGGRLHAHVHPVPLVNTALTLSQSHNVFVPLLAEKAVQASVAAGSAEAASIVQKNVATLRRDLVRASTPFLSTQKLLGDVSRGFGMDVAVEKAMLARQLVATPRGYLENYSVIHERTLQTKAILAVSSAVGTGYGADLIYSGVSAALGVSHSTLAQASRTKELLAQGWADAGATIVGAMTLGALHRDDLQGFADSLLSNAMGQAQATLERALGLPFSELYDAYNQRSKETESSTWRASSGQHLRTGAALLSTAAQLGIFDSETTAFVNNAVGYAQSAVQLAQAIDMFASVTSGGGAILAVSSLAGALGGLQAFGGSGVGGGGGQAATLGAIKQLHEYMKAEFAKVNAKLDYMMRQLDELVTRMIQQQLQLDEIRSLVSRTNQKLDVLSLRLDVGFLELKEELWWGDTHRSCMPIVDHGLGEGDTNRLATCLDHYSHVAQAASKSFGTARDEAHLYAARMKVRAAFGPAGSKMDQRASLADLAYVMYAGYHVPLPGTVVDVAQLQKATDLFTRFGTTHPKTTGSLLDTGFEATNEKVRKVRSSHYAYINYSNAVRAPSPPHRQITHLALDTLMTELEKVVEHLAGDLVAAREAILAHWMGLFEKGSLDGRNRLEYISLRNADASQGRRTRLQLFDASQIRSATSAVPPIYTEVAPGPQIVGMAEMLEYLHIPGGIVADFPSPAAIDTSGIRWLLDGGFCQVTLAIARSIPLPPSYRYWVYFDAAVQLHGQEVGRFRTSPLDIRYEGTVLQPVRNPSDYFTRGDAVGLLANSTRFTRDRLIADVLAFMKRPDTLAGARKIRSEHLRSHAQRHLLADAVLDDTKQELLLKGPMNRLKEELRNVIDAIHALCVTEYSEAYASYDALQTVLSDTPKVGILRDRLKEWAVEEVSSSDRPEASLQEDVKRLRQMLVHLIELDLRLGRPLPLERTRRAFDKAFPVEAFPYSPGPLRA